MKLNDVNLPGVYSRKSNSKSRKSRRGARSADIGLSSSKISRTSCDSMHVKTSFMDKRESRADREKIISGAEDFLQVHAWCCVCDVCVCVCVCVSCVF